MEELSDEQIETLRKALLTLQRDLRVTLADEGGRSETVDLDQPIGRLSRMDAMQQQEMAKAERRRAELRLGRITVSLEAIADEERFVDRADSIACCLDVIFDTPR